MKNIQHLFCNFCWTELLPALRLVAVSLVYCHHVNIELFSLLYLSTRNYPWYILFATCVRSHLVLGMINLNFVPFRHHCTFVLLSFCHLCRFSLIFWTPDSWSNRQHPCHLQSTVMVIMKRCLYQVYLVDHNNPKI